MIGPQQPVGPQIGPQEQSGEYAAQLNGLLAIVGANLDGLRQVIWDELARELATVDGSGEMVVARLKQAIKTKLSKTQEPITAIQQELYTDVLDRTSKVMQDAADFEELDQIIEAADGPRAAQSPPQNSPLPPQSYTPDEAAALIGDIDDPWKDLYDYRTRCDVTSTDYGTWGRGDDGPFPPINQFGNDPFAVWWFARITTNSEYAQPVRGLSKCGYIKLGRFPQQDSFLQIGPYMLNVRTITGTFDDAKALAPHCGCNFELTPLPPPPPPPPQPPPECLTVTVTVTVKENNDCPIEPPANCEQWQICEPVPRSLWTPLHFAASEDADKDRSKLAEWFDDAAGVVNPKSAKDLLTLAQTAMPKGDVNYKE